MPLHNSKVLPAGWSQHHRASAEGGMTATVTITNPPTKPGRWNPTSGDVADADGADIYSGLARIQASTDDQSTSDAADQTVTWRDYLIQVPATVATVRAGGEHPSRVTVTACPGDAAIVGRVLTVVDVVHGSEVWTRDLICRDDLTENNP